MFGKKKPPLPEVQEAMDERDDLLVEVKDAIKNVDRLVAEYAEAEKGK